MKGTIEISAPIRNHTREVIAALGISLIDDGEVQGRLQSLSNAVGKSCDEISSILGYLKVQCKMGTFWREKNEISVYDFFTKAFHKNEVI